VAGGRLADLEASELTLLRRRTVAIVFQFFNLLPFLNVYDNIALPLRLERLPRDEEELHTRDSLALVGLEHKATAMPEELSGGELQRVAIARSIAIKPEVLLADEPTGNLDSVAGRQIMNLLRSISDERGVTTLVVTHDPVWASLCDRVVRLTDGRIVEDLGFMGGFEETG